MKWIYKNLIFILIGGSLAHLGALIESLQFWVILLSLLSGIALREYQIKKDLKNEHIL